MFTTQMKILVVVLAVFICSGAAYADDVLEAIQEATEAYNEKAYTEAIVKYSADNQDGEIMINVAKKYLVIVKGSNVEKEDLMNYANALDYKGLKSF